MKSAARIVLASVLCLVALAQGALAQNIHLRDLRGERPFALRCTVRGPEQWPADAQATIVLNYVGNSYYAVRLSRSAVDVQKVIEGQARQLVPPRPIAQAPEHEVKVRRELARLLVVCDGDIVAECFDTDLAGGKVGWATSTPELRVEDLSVTHFEPLFFMDSFERQEGSSGNWEIVEGSFGNISLNSQKPRPELAANPFSFGSTTFERTLAVNGSWHWTNYRFSAAVKGVGVGALGLAFYVQDRDNYYLFRWVALDENAAQGHQRQLIRVRNGRWTLLESHPGGFAPDRWYRMTVRATGSHVEGYIDDELVFARDLGEYGMGRIGLYSSGGAGTAYFDDVAVLATDRLADDFEGPAAGRWIAEQGSWVARGGLLYGRATGQLGTARTGELMWRDTECSVRARLAPGASAGLVLRDTGEGKYIFLVQHTSAGKCEGRWLRLARGTVAVLSSGVIPLVDTAVTLSALAEGPYLEGRVNGRVVAQCVDGTLPYGQVGLAVAGPGEVPFDDFLALEKGPPEPPPPITEQFTREATMAGWASASGRWTEEKTNGRLVRWYKGTFYSDVSLAVALPRPQKDRGKLWLTLCGDGKDLLSGYTAFLDDENPAQAAITLTRAGVQVAETQVNLAPDEEHIFALARRGGLVYICVDGAPVLSHLDVAPLRGRRVALASEGLKLNLSKVAAEGRNVLEYTFSRAPVDWYPVRGVWEVSDRWACFPGWAWFCGKGDDAPLIWSKRTFRGDLTLEWYAALAMLTDEGTGYPHPSDINCTICADGKRLDSGYSFIFNGWNNKKTAILKQGKIVAETDRGRFKNPVRTNNAFHRHWFYVRVEKEGATLRLSVDGTTLLEWTDPQPLEGGHIAFWTYKNGLMNARTRISFEAGGNKERIVVPATWEGDLPYSIYQ